MTSVPSAIDESAQSRADDVSFVRIGVALIAILGCIFFVFERFLLNQGKWGIRAPADWGHTLIIPLMGFYLAWINRDRLSRIRFRTTWIALVPIALGVGWYLFTWIGPSAIRNHTLQGWGLGLTTFGLVLLFFGWRAMPWLIFPVAYVFLFGVKIGDRVMTAVTYKLQDLAAHGSHFVFQVLQFDVSRHGNALELVIDGQTHDLNIAEACSGMRMLVAFLALGVFMAYTMLNRNWQRIVLVLCAVPVALAVNVLRVVTLGLLSIVNPDLATGDFHTFIGLLWLVPAFLMYLGIMWVLRRVVVDDAKSTKRKLPPSEPGAGRFDHHARLAVIVACITLLVSGAGFRSVVGALNIYLSKEPVSLRRDLSKIPVTLGDWRRIGDADVMLSEAITQELGTRHYLSRYYVNETTDRVLQLHITYYTDQIDAVPHVPERCSVAQGWTIDTREHVPLDIDRSRWLEDFGPKNARGETYSIVQGLDPLTRRKYEVRMPLGDFVLRSFLFRSGEQSDQLMNAGYFFITNGWVTANAAEIRRLAFDQTDAYAYYCKVEFSRGVPDGVDPSQFTDDVESLLTPLLPELMRCLPDWADVEQGRYPAPSEGAQATDATAGTSRD